MGRKAQYVNFCRHHPKPFKVLHSTASDCQEDKKMFILGRKIKTKMDFHEVFRTLTVSYVLH